MATTAIPSLPAAWLKLVKELLQQQSVYANFSAADLDWGAGTIVETFSQLKPEVLYRDLVYMNRCSKIGQFALTFADQLNTAILAHDAKAVHTVLSTATTPEFDGKSLTTEQYNAFSIALNREMTTMNALMDRVASMKTVPSTILEPGLVTKCRKDVCVAASPPEGVKEETSFDHLASGTTWVSDHASAPYAAWCFRLPELLQVLVLDANNPYTDKPFSPATRKALLARYDVEAKLVKTYLNGPR